MLDRLQTSIESRRVSKLPALAMEYGYLLYICIFFCTETPVCTSFYYDRSPILQLKDRKFYPSSSIYRVDTTMNSEKFRERCIDKKRDIDYIVNSILTSPRDKSTRDILDEIAGVEHYLSWSTVMHIMQGLVMKRDHIRFGDMLTYHRASGGIDIREVRQESNIDMIDSRSIIGQVSSNIPLPVAGRENDAFQCLELQTPNSKIVEIFIENESASKLEGMDDISQKTADLDLMMLLLQSVQRMKSKKRSFQSSLLLQKAKTAKFDQKIVDILALSIILSTDPSAVNRISSTSSFYKEIQILTANFTSDEKLMDANVVNTVNRMIENFENTSFTLTNPRTSSNEIAHKSDSHMFTINSDTYTNTSNQSTACRYNFLPPTVFTSLLAVTPSWSSVRDVISEYKQHELWQLDVGNLDVITCLNLIHGTVLDKQLSLLVQNKLKSLSDDRPPSSFPSSFHRHHQYQHSIYQEAVDLLLFIHKNPKLHTINSGDVLLLGVQGSTLNKIECDEDDVDMKDDDMKCRYRLQTTNSFQDVFQFIGCQNNYRNTSYSTLPSASHLSSLSSPPSLSSPSSHPFPPPLPSSSCSSSSSSSSLCSPFLQDSRLIKAIQLASIPQKSRERGRNIGTHSDEDDLEIAVNESSNRSDNDNDNENENVKRKEKVFPCAFYQSIVNTLDAKKVVEEEENDTTACAGTSVDATQILILGDGDLSFSTSLIRIQNLQGMRIKEKENLLRSKPVKVKIENGYGDSVENEVGNENGNEKAETNHLNDESLSHSNTARSNPKCNYDTDTAYFELTVSTFESHESLLKKYANSEENIKFIEASHLTQFSRNIDDEKKRNRANKENAGNVIIDMENNVTDDGNAVDVEVEEGGKGPSHTVMYNVDATQIDKKYFPGKQFDVIIFNFPFGDAVKPQKQAKNFANISNSISHSSSSLPVFVPILTARTDNSTIPSNSNVPLTLFHQSTTSTLSHQSTTTTLSHPSTTSTLSHPSTTSTLPSLTSLSSSSSSSFSPSSSSSSSPPIPSLISVSPLFPSLLLSSAKEHVNDIQVKMTEPLDSSLLVMKNKLKKTKKSDDFDTHWIARGRHMLLLSGVFQSAKNVLRSSPVDNDNVHNNSQTHRVIDFRGVRSSFRVDPKHTHRDRDRESSSCVDANGSTGDSEENVSSIQTEIPVPTQHPEQQPAQELEQQPTIPKVMITLLLSQAAEWEIEKLAKSEGFLLSEIIPFEDIIFSTYGYSRKRTYSDDIFPSSSSFSSSFSNIHNVGHLDTLSIDLIYSIQREQWRRNIIEAWTFVFVPAN